VQTAGTGLGKNTKVGRSRGVQTGDFLKRRGAKGKLLSGMAEGTFGSKEGEKRS